MTCLISNASLQPPVYDVYTALLIRVIPNQHFKSTLLGGKKEYAVYACENDDNYGRPLTRDESPLVYRAPDASEDSKFDCSTALFQVTVYRQLARKVHTFRL